MLDVWMGKNQLAESCSSMQYVNCMCNHVKAV